MTKYSLVVLESEREEFLARLQELGMVDITTTAWQPSQDDVALMAQIEAHREAAEYLARIEAGGKPYGTGAEAFDKYTEARHQIAIAEGEIARLGKLAVELEPLGEFDPDKLRALVNAGVELEVFELTALPEQNYKQIEAQVAELEADRRSWEAVLARAAATRERIEAEGDALADRLQFNRSAASGERVADERLVVMEAWVRESGQAEVDAALDAQQGLLYLKSKPTPDDEVPVELRNSRIARPFEFIGDLYAKPRYGTMDLTRWFAPFYMIFFGFCLADLGYGLLIALAGVYLALKGKGGMKAIGTLSIYCGGAAVVFGFFAGSMFGIDIKEWFPGIRHLFFTSNVLFSGALALGVFQILFGMTLKAITTTRAFGIKYAFSTIGWIMVIVTLIAAMVPQMAGLQLGIPKLALFIFGGAGLAMMLFLNNPGKNIFVNFGGGLWELYNNITGFLSDALSYIRLFAIGLSGGVLAAVFNDLAVGMSGDIPVLKQLIMLLILAIGHGLNLFMSTLSSMVHPLRLTFVEFYKNAGFEASSRVFNPLKKSNKL